MIDFSLFCARDGKLSTPSTVEEHTYATDGFIAIRVPIINGYDAFPGNTKTMLSIFASEPQTYEPLPDFDDPGEQDRDCNFCGGSGQDRERGECRCCGEPYDCEYCKEGKVAKHPKGVVWHNRRLNEFYLQKIATLPGVEMSPEGSPFDLVHFRFTGGRGALMPMKP